MKKNLKSIISLPIIVLCVFLFQITGCKKDDPQTPSAFPIEGLWIGTYAVDGQPALGQQYFSFVIKPDGTMINDTKSGGQQNLAVGTWTLNGNVLSCTFTNVYGQSQHIGLTETSTATWDKAGKLVSGIWKNVPPLVGSGTFTLARVN